MTRLGAILLLVATWAGPLGAQNNEAVCLGDDSAEVVAEACAALIAAEGFEPSVEVFAALGDALEDLDRDLEAFGAYGEALALDPENDAILRDRAYVAHYAGLPGEAMADIDRALALNPDRYWAYYWKGFLLAEQGAHQEAVDWFDLSLERREDYYFSNYSRALSLYRADRAAESVPAFQRTLELRPFIARNYLFLADVQNEIGDTAGAIRNFRIAQLLDPNLGHADYQLAELAPVPESPPALAPLDYAVGADGRGYRYIAVVTEVDTRDEMEIAIMAIADWFSSSRIALPEAKGFLTRRFTAGADDLVEISTATEAADGLPGGLGSARERFRGLMPMRLTPPDPSWPAFEIAYDSGNLAELWPLQTGRQVTGEGRYWVACPPEGESNFFFIMVGCRPEAPDPDVGFFEYNFEVIGTERVTVPMGQFDTFVVRYRELGYREMGGVRQDRVYEVKWWISPETGDAVRTSFEADGKLLTLEAIEPMGPA